MSDQPATHDRSIALTALVQGSIVIAQIGMAPAGLGVSEEGKSFHKDSDLRNQSRPVSNCAASDIML